MTTEREIYLDNSATTKPYLQTCEAITSALREQYYNPSAIYERGIVVSKKIEEYRRYIASTLGCEDKEITFTSGGTESINTAIASVSSSRKKHIVTSMVEHPATLEAMKKMEENGFVVTYLKPTKEGSITTEQVLENLREDTALISLMAVNNELGSKTDFMAIAKAVKRNNPQILIHIDAVQAYLKEPISLCEGVIDFLSASGHKIHAPKGVGFLYHRMGVKLPAYIVGGGQEKNFRSGTENVPGIYGMGEAIKTFYPQMNEKLKQIENTKDYLKNRIVEEIDKVIILSPEDSVCHILNMSFIGLRGEILLHSLEAKGIYVSTGSACSSKKAGSHVLNAVGFKKEEKEGAIRFSFSEENSIEEMERVVTVLKENVNEIRTIMKFGKGRNV